MTDAPSLAAWRSAVLRRDGRRCRRCGAAGAPLHAHHVRARATHPHLARRVANGRTLCVPCHNAVHRARHARARRARQQAFQKSLPDFQRLIFQLLG